MSVEAIIFLCFFSLFIEIFAIGFAFSISVSDIEKRLIRMETKLGRVFILIKRKDQRE